MGCLGPHGEAISPTLKGWKRWGEKPRPPEEGWSDTTRAKAVPTTGEWMGRWDPRAGQSHLKGDG